MREAKPPPPSKVLMQSIQALTFQRGEMTTARRGEPIPQLQCEGKPCKRYQPESIACLNIGSDGAGGVQWKCEADLPSSLRLGKVQVSCEGWNRPGDRYVLQGSCGLEYGLVQVDAGLEGEGVAGYARKMRNWQDYNPAALLFYALFIFAFTWIFYSFLRNLVSRFTRHSLPPARRFFPFLGWFGGGGPGGGGGGGPPPPPYSRHPKPADPGVANAPASQGTAPATGGLPGGTNFWAGLGIGALGTNLFMRAGNRNQARDPPVRPRGGFGESLFDDGGRETRGWGGGGGEARRRAWEGGRAHGGDRAESSRMGEMRSATGFGGTNVR